MAEEKQCSSCNFTKDITSFTKINGNKRHRTCIECVNKKYTEMPVLDFYDCDECGKTKANTEFSHWTGRRIHTTCRECINSAITKIRTETTTWLREYKMGKSCLDCNKIFDPVCMDFDHVRGKKVDKLSTMAANCASKNELLAEIDKCDLVCAMCHKKRTISRLPERTETVAHKIINAKIIQESKDVPCNICGEKYEFYCMEFDHLDGYEKVNNVCQLVFYKTETLLAEIAKCQILCIACHRLKSIKEHKEKKEAGLIKYTKRKKCTRTDTHKICKKCNQEKEFKDYSKNNVCLDGLHKVCNECNDYGEKDTYRCGECGAIKPKAEFNPRNSSEYTPRLVSSSCKVCLAEYKRKRGEREKALKLQQPTTSSVH